MGKVRSLSAADSELVGGALTRVFGKVGDEVLKHLRAGLEPISLAARGVLYREGEPGDCMYIVVKGRVQASIAEPDGRTLHIGTAPTSGEKWLFSQWIRIPAA